MTHPSVTAQHDPGACHCCGRHASGIGLSNPTRFFCTECALLLERIKEVRRMDPYEILALDGGVDAVGDFIDSIGGKTELAEFDEQERRGLVQAAWRGCADRLRHHLDKGLAPF